jgi:hypothetical protein
MRSQDYSWAGYSHVEISLKAIAAAMAYRHDWNHFVFLSEQHLPLKNVASRSSRFGYDGRRASGHKK